MSTSGGQPRQRLRPWLIDQINSGAYPGLEWLDSDELTFKIPWKHFGRPGVNEQKDALLFRNYAIHTKKFKEGEQADVSAWKTRFRCALHKHPEIEEVNRLNQLDGSSPYRVYRFIRRLETDVVKVNAAAQSPDHEPNPVLSSPTYSYSELLTVEDIEDHLKEEYTRAGKRTYPDAPMDTASSASLDVDFHLPIEPTDMDLVDTLLSGNAYSIASPASSNAESKAFDPHLLNNVLRVPLNGMQLTPINIRLFYGDQEVSQRTVDNPRGMRVAFNPPPPLPEDVVKEGTSEVVSHIFGPIDAEQIYFPPAFEEKTAGVLNCIKRGIVFQGRNGEIHATRLCRAKVFYSDSLNPHSEVLELKREDTTKVFDYYNQFVPALQQYILGQRSAPSYELFFSFGQKWSSVSPIKTNYIHMNVTHIVAQSHMKEIHKQATDNILVSEPNMLDMIAVQIEGLSVGSGADVTQSESANKETGTSYPAPNELVMSPAASVASTEQ